LLDRMTQSAGGRGPLISEDLRSRLQEYLEFRHFFRHSYSFQLQWEKMKPLVQNLVAVHAALRNELGLGPEPEGSS
jgi:hypothetical protein